MLHLSEVLEEKTSRCLDHNKQILEHCKDLQAIAESSKRLESIIDRFTYGITFTSTLLERETVVVPGRVGFDVNWVPPGRVLNIEKTIDRCQSSTHMQPLKKFKVPRRPSSVASRDGGRISQA